MWVVNTIQQVALFCVVVALKQALLVHKDAEWGNAASG